MHYRDRRLQSWSCKRPPCQQEPLRHNLELHQTPTHQLCQSNCRRVGSQPGNTSAMGKNARTRAPELDHRCHLGRGAAKPLGWSKWEVEVAERGSKHGWTLLQPWTGAPRDQEGSRGHPTQNDRGACGTISRTLRSVSTGITFTLTERGAKGETEWISGAMDVPWSFKEIMRCPTTMLLSSSHAQLKS